MKIWVHLSCFLAFLAVAQGNLQTDDGFALPQPGRQFQFPRDHGSHPEFKIEWWYITGHLFSGDRRFGFQATFFRRAERAEGSGEVRQLHLAHMAVVDVATGRFLHQERLAREGWDAEASTSTLDLRNGGWSLRFVDASDRMQLKGNVRGDARLTLELEPRKPLVFFGENGVSRKGDDATAASHYLTFTRLGTRGALTLGDQTFQVEGEAWMDHEISSSQLSRDQAGWDWISIQLSDMREVMVYRLRKRDGTSDPASRLYWIGKEGNPIPAPFEWVTRTTWTSPFSKSTYPALVELRTREPETGKDVVFTVTPVVPDQELRGGVVGIDYWEGACDVDLDGKKRSGRAYMELTGYAKDLSF